MAVFYTEEKRLPTDEMDYKRLYPTFEFLECKASALPYGEIIFFIIGQGI